MVQPEVCFWALGNRRAMVHKKKSKAGFEEPRRFLASAFELAIPERSEMRSWTGGAAYHDALDAVVAAWSAARWAEGSAGRLPEAPEFDVNGLRMERVF